MQLGALCFDHARLLLVIENLEVWKLFAPVIERSIILECQTSYTTQEEKEVASYGHYLMKSRVPNHSFAIWIGMHMFVSFMLPRDSCSISLCIYT